MIVFSLNSFLKAGVLYSVGAPVSVPRQGSAMYGKLEVNAASLVSTPVEYCITFNSRLVTGEAEPPA
jgi:hypothetical protein